MDQSLVYSLQIVSTFSVVLPILVGITLLRTMDQSTKFFLVFLGFGLVTDLLGWFLYLHSNGQLNTIIRYGYVVIESVFCLWFVVRFSNMNKVRVYLSKIWIFMIVLWLACLPFKNGLAFFETVSQVLVAFVSSFAILSIIETSNSRDYPLSLGLIGGIFFYSFCTFFFMTLLSSEFGIRLWYLHNIVNILTNIIYLIALGIFRSKLLRDPSAKV